MTKADKVGARMATEGRPATTAALIAFPQALLSLLTLRGGIRKILEQLRSRRALDWRAESSEISISAEAIP
jgi:hypothetical protein